ncbi:MAG TPA: hypothetical protein VEQ10_18450 [Vicinamibacteria bacterium]|nr:hypothetical protein [Vicinamibacteria bacterium]
MRPSELLTEVLRLARQEGALEGDALRSFAEALAERAELIVEERLSREQTLVRELEWRRETLASLEQELSWRREAMASLGQELSWYREAMASLEQELSWRREAMASLEQQATALQRELEWRRGTLSSLEQELSWRRQAMTSLQEENDWRRQAMASLQEENDWRRRVMDGLEGELRQLHADVQAARDDKDAASSAHDRLLGHHREVLARMRSELVSGVAARFYRWPAVRRRLATLAEELRG